MKTKPVTPWERLSRKYHRALAKAMYPRRVTMWVYPKDKLETGWSLTGLSERVRAADQLGYDVRLIWKDDGLTVQYVERFVEPD
jgi:hypothetical protein